MPKLPAADTVTVCGVSALAGVKTSVLVERMAAGLVVEIASGTVTFAVGTDFSTTVNEEPGPPCITLESCVGVITIPSTGSMWRSPTATCPGSHPVSGYPAGGARRPAADAFGSSRIGIVTVAVADPAAKLTTVLTEV